MKTLVNFVLVCVLIPGVYGVIAFWYYGHLAHQKVAPLNIAIIISTPLFLTGFRDWWDVWVVPFPKLGSPWQKLLPKELYASLFKIHGLALAVCLVVHLWSNHGIASQKFEPSTLDAPRTKARIERFELLIAKEERGWLPATENLDKFPEVKEEGLPFRTHEKLVDDFIEERDKLAKQLANHEAKVKFLSENPTEASDTFNGSVVWCLFVFAGSNWIFEPKKRRFDSGDPIERA